MGVLSNIMNAIFGSKASASPAQAPSGSAPASGSSSMPASSPAAPTQGESGGAASGGSVDVAAVLDKAVAAKKQKLEWRTSIVDLMKALDLDSSLSARKELAKDLHYDGDTNDSAKNIWLHKQVMQKLAENGGKLPPDIKH